MSNMQVEQINRSKQIPTDYDIHPLFKKRWSPRSFDNRAISREDLMELFEAARFAASAFNEQPWKYVYAYRGSQEFDALHASLSAGNQPWTSRAAVLVVSIARKVMTKTGKYNAWAEHDLGMANAQLLLQAAYRDIYAHCMAGFSKEKVVQLLKMGDDEAPVCMIALGYLGDPDKLIEPYKTRELAPRTRKNLDDFARQARIEI